MVAISDAHKYRSMVTDKGKEKIAVAMLNGKKVNITSAAVGDGGGEHVEPLASMTELVNEVWRGEIANKQINPESANMMDVKVILPADVGGFTAREAGLFDEDGDLIAICNMPPAEKAVITTGAAGTLTLLIHIVFADVEAVEFKINPNLDAVSTADVERMIREHMATTQMDITIPISGWKEDPDTGGAYALCTDIPAEGITEEMIPMLTILPECQQAATDCGLCTTIRTIEGALRVYAKETPAAEIRGNLALLCSGAAGGGAGGSYTLPTATATRLGGVKIGKNVNVEADGTISVDGDALIENVTATDGDVTEMLNAVFGNKAESGN